MGLRRDSYLIDAVIDAARVTDDFVRGVIGLADGVIGDDNRSHSWLQRRLQGRGQRSIVRGMGSRFAAEQLRKAADEADELVGAVHALGAATTAAARDAHDALLALGIEQLAVSLRDPTIDATSSEVRDVHRTLSRSIAVLNDARAVAVLAEMRAARDRSQGTEHSSG